MLGLVWRVEESGRNKRGRLKLTLASRVARVVGIPKIGGYTDFFQNSVFFKMG